MSKPNEQLERWWASRIGISNGFVSRVSDEQRQYFFQALLSWGGSADCFAALEAIMYSALRPKCPQFEIAQDWVRGKLPNYEKQIMSAALDVLASVDDSVFDTVADNIGKLIRPLNKEELDLANSCPATINSCQRLLPPPNKPDLFDACMISRIELLQPNLQRQISLMAEFALDPAIDEMPKLRKEILDRLELIQRYKQVDEKPIHNAFEQKFAVFAADICAELRVEWKHAVERVVDLAVLFVRNLPQLEEEHRHQLLGLIADKPSPPVYMVAPELIRIARPDVACQLIMRWVGHLGWREWDLDRNKRALCTRGILKEVTQEFPVMKQLALDNLPEILTDLSDEDMAYLVSLSGSSGHHGPSRLVYGWIIPAVTERIKANRGYFRENFAKMFPNNPPNTAPEVVVPIVNALWDDELRPWAKKWLQRVHLPTWDAECVSTIDWVLTDFVIPHDLPAGEMLSGRVRSLHELAYKLQPEDVESDTFGGLYKKWLPYLAATPAPMPQIWQDNAWRKTLLSATDKGLDMSIEWLFTTAKQFDKADSNQDAVAWLDSLLGLWQEQSKMQRQAILKLALDSSSSWLGRPARAYLKSHQSELSGEEEKRLDDYVRSHLLATLLNETELVSHLELEELRTVFFERKFDKVFPGSSGCGLGNPADLEFLFAGEELREKRLCPWLSMHSHHIHELDWLVWVNHFDLADHFGIRQRVSKILAESRDHEVRTKALEILTPFVTSTS